MAADSKIPFVGRIFWPLLVAIVLLVVGSWYLIPRFSEYKIEPQDYVGSSICGVILSYLIHLWLLPAAPTPPSDQSGADDAK